MLGSINGTFDLLQDGKWHELDEIAEKHGLSQRQVGMVINFLAEYDFVTLDKENQKAKLTPPAFKFITEIQQVEENENFANQIC